MTATLDGVAVVVVRVARATNPATFTYTAAELAQLKAIAKAQGTYYQGARTSLPATGIVFIDTVDGSDFDQNTPSSMAGSLTLAGNNTFNGIVVVAGTVAITGNTTINGLIYALNGLTATAGNVTINGAVASENRRDVSSTNLDSAAPWSSLTTAKRSAMRAASPLPCGRSSRAPTARSRVPSARIIHERRARQFGVGRPGCSGVPGTTWTVADSEPGRLGSIDTPRAVLVERETGPGTPKQPGLPTPNWRARRS